jgi:hypothetical protein
VYHNYNLSKTNESTNIDDYINTAKQFANHSAARGYDENYIVFLFTQAAKELNRIQTKKQKI